MQNELKSAIRFNDFVAYFGARGVVALAWWMGAAHAARIREHQNSFPFLQINGAAGSNTNTARMNELKAVTPLAMVEGTARDLIQYLGSNAYTGPFQLGGMDRGACLVGELTGGFLKKWQIESMVDNQAVRNSLQYLVYTQYDNPQATIAQAQEQLGKMSDWPLGVGSFERGLTANLKGIDACYLSARAT